MGMSHGMDCPLDFQARSEIDNPRGLSGNGGEHFMSLDDLEIIEAQAMSGCRHETSIGLVRWPCQNGGKPIRVGRSRRAVYGKLVHPFLVVDDGAPRAEN